MSSHQTLSIADIKAAFLEEVADAGGAPADVYEDKDTLVARSTLPRLRDVTTGDSLKGGCAIRAAGCQACVHPFLYRLVCRNGAIMASAIESRRIDQSQFATSADVEQALRETVRACCADETFAGQTDLVRSTRDRAADLTLLMFPMLNRPAPGGDRATFGQRIMRRFLEGMDRSSFGLMNAITSVARDTPDPETRWRLEELGGGVPLFRGPPTRPARASAGASAVVGSGA